MNRAHALLFVAIVACAGESDVARESVAISGGGIDTVDVAVVGIIDNSGGGTCTGSLIAPDLVVTAQHCVATPVGIGMCDQGGFGPPRSPASFFVTTRAQLTANPADYHRVAEIVIPPGSGFCGRDIALLRLVDEVAASEAAPIAPRIAPVPAVAERYAAVGFGATDDSGTGADQRRRRDALTVACVGAGCSSTYVGDAEWLGEAGVCAGDSGGPALDDGGRVIGIASRGAVGCINPTYVMIASHGEWLIAEAIRIANLGGYAPPTWTGAPPPVDASVDSLPADAAVSADAAAIGDDSGGCQTSSATPSVALLLLLTLGLVLVRRRR